MDKIKSYKKNVIESKNLVFVSILIALVLRVFFYSTSKHVIETEASSYLWNSEFVEYYLSKDFFSAILSLLFTIGIILYCAFLNNKHKLIRNQTLLINVFLILAFSSSPVFVYMDSLYISLLLLLISFDVLMNSYLETNGSFHAYKIGFLIAVASLFSIQTLLYIPIFWIGLKYMRCLNIKTLCASIFGALTIYWIVFCFFSWQNDHQALRMPFAQSFAIINLSSINEFKPLNFSLLIVATIGIVAMLINYQLASFQDKIQTRANLSFLFFLCSFSLLFNFIFIPSSSIYLFVLATSGSILLAHFFTLIEGKWKIYLFYCSFAAYAIYCVYALLNQNIMSVSIM